MEPLSFDEFMKQEKKAGPPGEVENEPFDIENCPLPGCGSKELTPVHEDGLIKGFSCDKGCSFMVKRNSFTGDFVYYFLSDFVKDRFDDPDSFAGIKISAIGEVYTDWY
jgi:hypothetical protein